MRRVLLLLPWVLSACLAEPEEEGRLPAPDFVRSTVPADGAQRVGSSFDLSVTFRQPVPAGDLQLRLLPEPVDLPAPIQAGRTWSWRGIDVDDGISAMVVLVDGLDMDRPYLFNFHVGTRPSEFGRIGGEIVIPSWMEDPGEVVVFAYPVIPDALDFTAAQLAQRPAIMATRPVRTVNGLEYVMTDLVDGEAYHLLAVVDSNGDAHRHPAEDIHGLFREEGSPGSVVARGFSPPPSPFPAWRTDVDLELVAADSRRKTRD